jgi:hypothetical protein
MTIDDDGGAAVAIEYGCLRRAWNWLVWNIWTRRLRLWIPRLVWLGDEVDVQVTFSEHGLGTGGNLFEIEQKLHDWGIGFDAGAGFEGRDWEWDFSLRGPIRVKFRGRCKTKERRLRPPDRRSLFRVIIGGSK